MPEDNNTLKSLKAIIIALNNELTKQIDEQRDKITLNELLSAVLNFAYLSSRDIVMQIPDKRDVAFILGQIDKTHDDFIKDLVEKLNEKFGEFATVETTNDITYS